MKKFNNKIFIIFISLIILLVISLAFFIFKKPENNPVKNNCQNKDYKISLTLQSGERGVIKLTDNYCDLPINQKNDLLFKVLSDNAVEDSLYNSRLYFWLRNPKLTIEEQVTYIIDKQFPKNNFCQVKRNKYAQFDNLPTFELVIDPQAKLENLDSNNCLLFKPINSFSEEFFLETNNLLVLERQDGLNGIMPYNLASISFIKN